VTHFHFPAAFCCGSVAAALKSIDYNVAMTFILNNNNNNNNNLPLQQGITCGIHKHAAVF